MSDSEMSDVVKKMYVNGDYINQTGRRCKFEIYEILFFGNDVEQDEGGGGGGGGSPLKKRQKQLEKKYEFSIKCPDTRLQILDISREQIREFLNYVLNQGKNWNLNGTIYPGIWIGTTFDFFPVESDVDSQKAGDSLIVLGQQMARARRGELELSKEVLKEFGGKEYPREALKLLQLKEFSKEEQLLGAFKDEPQNLLTMRTKLMFNAYKGNIDMIHTLITKYKANVNLEDYEGKNALCFAAEEGHLDAVKILIAYGANVNPTARPIYDALYNRHYEVVRTLIAAGAVVASRPAETSLVWVASQNGNLQMLREILDIVPTEIEKRNLNRTPLYRAIEKGHLEVVQELLDRGSNVNSSQLSIGSTPLMAASERGYLQLVRDLISRGANVNYENSLRQTALWVASFHGNLEIVQELLARGAAVNTAMVNGSTPLFIASQNGHLEVVRELISRGASIDIADSNGVTPLAIAIINGHSDIKSELIARGAKFDILYGGGIV